MTLAADVIGSRFGRNTFLLVRANIITQGLLLAATPILTRFFGPEDFGIAGLLLVWAALFSAVASFRFEWSIPSARTDEDAEALAALSLLLVSGLAVALLLVLTVPDQRALFGLFGMDPIALSPLVPALGFAGSTGLVLSSVYVRLGDMGRVSLSRYVQSITQLVVSLLSGFAGLGALGLALGYTLSAAVGAITLLLGLPMRLAAVLRRSGALIASAKRYFRQASLSTAVSVVNFFFGNALPLLLLVGYSAREVGFYFVAVRLASAPTALISSGISSSFWSEAAALAKTDPLKLRAFYLKTVRRLVLFSIPVVLGCLAAPLFLPFILGAHEWGEIGIVVAACIPQIVGVLIFSSTNHLIVYDRQGYQLFSDLLSIASSVAVLWFAVALKLPFWGAIFIISNVVLLAYLVGFALHL